MSRKRPLSLFHEWHVVGELGQDIEDDGLLKIRVAENAECAKQGPVPPHC